MCAVLPAKRRFPVAACLLAAFTLQPAWALAQAAKPAAAPSPQAQAADLNRQLGAIRIKMGRLLLAGDFGSDQQDAGNYLDLRVQMLVSEGFRTELPDLRKDILRELRTAHNAGAKTAIAQMNSFYLDRFQKIAFDSDPNKYHMAARYNAMLMIGDLDEQQLDRLGNKPSIPLPAAVPILVSAVTDPNIHDAIRAAALVGLVRHARLGIADKQKAEKDVLAAMISLLGQKQEPVTRSASAHRYFREKAAEIMGLLGRPGLNAGGKEALTALETAVKDTEEPLAFRCEVAKNLGLFKYPAPGPDPALVATLGDLAVEITKQELTGRGMRLYLFYLQTALAGPEGQPADQPRKGLADALPAATKKTAVELVTKVTDLAKLIEESQKRGANPQTMAAILEAEGEKLKQWLATNQLAAG